MRSTAFAFPTTDVLCIWCSYTFRHHLLLLFLRCMHANKVAIVNL
uniref:Uncharacterized protein n=1 Tax=Setaria italica TaxID=4555 RepID=K3XTG9_SETIT